MAITLILQVYIDLKTEIFFVIMVLKTQTNMVIAMVNLAIVNP
jgi:hypothetical protein